MTVFTNKKNLLLSAMVLSAMLYNNAISAQEYYSPNNPSIVDYRTTAEKYRTSTNRLLYNDPDLEYLEENDYRFPSETSAEREARALTNYDEGSARTQSTKYRLDTPLRSRVDSRINTR